MQIIQCINTNFLQLENTLQKISNVQYINAVKVISNASIGQHVRHIIEVFQSLEEGYKTTIINYNKRKRDKEIENNKSVAIDFIETIKNNLVKENIELRLQMNDPLSSGSHLQIQTNYYRELLYNLDHLIHHMAIIRIAINETTKIELAEEFGIAPATLEYRRACAQSPTSL